MTRYADPFVCPGCRSAIEYGAPRCPHCELPLTGNTAQTLFTTLMRADQLVEQLRTPVAAGPVLPAGSPAGSPAGPAAAPVTPAAPVRTPWMSSASVPKILLGLGALCLLVAALVFLAVAWSAMGMGGRTAVLVALTATAGGLCAWISARGLRFGAESFVAVALGLLTLDVFGAESAGWLGDISGSDFAVLLGGVLGLVATGAALLALRSPVERLTAAELAAALGLQLAIGGWLSADHIDLSVGYVAAVLVSAGAAFATWRARLVFGSIATTGAAGLWWLLLLGDGLDRGLSEPTMASLWGEMEIWPVLAAAALVAGPAAIARLPWPVRIGASAVSVTVIAVAAALPAAGNSLTVGAVAALLVLAAASAVGALAPGRWGWSSVGALTLAGISTFGVLMLLLAQAADRVLSDPWSVAVDSRLSGVAPEASPLLVVPAVVLLGVAVWVVLRLVGVSVDLRPLTTPALGVAAGGLAATVALYPAPRWGVVAVLLVGVVAAWALSRERPAGLLVTSLLSAAALLAALPSEWLSAAALLVVSALAFAVDFRSRGAVQVAAGALSIVLIGSLLWTSGDLALMPEVWLAVLVIGIVGLLALVRPVPAYELAAAPTALVAILVVDPDLTWLAIHLTLAGALVSASALYHRRRELGWIGSGLLFVATWIRLIDLEVSTVEAYTMPLAVALVGFGLYRMYVEDAGTITSLSPGLGLAVVPSLLQALSDPVSPRALLVGVGCAALVIAGSSLRWSAPLLIGAGAGLLLVLLEAGYAEVLSQWMIIGLIGAVLTVIGVTWEARLQELRLAMGYVRGLR